MGFNLRNRPLNAKELAQRWGVTPGYVRKMAGRGELPHFRLGTSKRAEVRFRVEDVEAWEAAQCARSSTEAHGTPSGEKEDEPDAPPCGPKIVGLPNSGWPTS